MKEEKKDKLLEFLMENIRYITHEEWWIIEQVIFHPIEHYYKTKERDRIKKILSVLAWRAKKEGLIEKDFIFSNSSKPLPVKEEGKIELDEGELSTNSPEEVVGETPTEKEERKNVGRNNFRD